MAVKDCVLKKAKLQTSLSRDHTKLRAFVLADELAVLTLAKRSL